MSRRSTVENKPLQKNRQRERLSFKIAAIYAVLGALWIFFSDRVAAILSSTPEALTQISIIKGWLYVLLTTLLLYNLVSRGMKELVLSQEASSERRKTGNARSMQCLT
jgi:hypothetical protein